MCMTHDKDTTAAQSDTCHSIYSGDAYQVSMTVCVMTDWQLGYKLSLPSGTRTGMLSTTLATLGVNALA